ncbi:MAG: TonB-dependent receptor, partial [Deltaproteobacteria bacterium]|nr:TonB-dependent receptor [Deltaproteobacteria bacterium]
WVEVEDPIYYAPNGFYINGDAVSSYGIESEFRFVPSWGSIKLGYSYYVADESGVPAWSTDDSDKAAGLPNHKFTYDVTYQFKDNWSLNCNGFIGSSRRSWSDPDGDWTASPKTWGSEVITNLYLMHERGPLTLGVGVSDLFNEKQEYAPAYDNWSGAIPAMSREIFVKASLEF